MNEIILKRIGALLSVKSIVTLALTEFMVVYTVVIAFYFGTQTQKISDAVESKGAQ